MQDPNLSASQRDEFKSRAADVRKQLEHIRAERAEMESREKHEGDQGPLRLVAFNTERVSADAAGEVLKRSGLKVGDPITEDSLRRVKTAAAAVDQHFAIVMHDDGRGGVSLVLVSRE
jgi:hypothetical protein